MNKPLLSFQHFTKEAIKAKQFSTYTMGDIKEALNNMHDEFLNKAETHFEEHLKVQEL